MLRKIKQMIEVAIDLTEDEYQTLNSKFPRSMQSAKVGERAIELVRIYFKKKYPNCSFVTPQSGADLLVLHGYATDQLEIKGTESPEVSWAKIKVSSNQSYELLKKGMPIYRVVSVFERNPRIFIMKNHEDFEMVPEARWSVKPRRNA